MVHRREVVKFSAATLGSMVLGGCQDLGGQASSSGSGEAPRDVADDALEGETITIGHLAPQGLSSPAESVRAAEMAIKEHNENGGVLGADVEQITRDTGLSPGKAGRLYQDIEPDVDMTMGLYLTPSFLRAYPNIATAQKLHFNYHMPTNRLQRLVEENYEKFKYIFRPTLNINHNRVSEAHFIETQAERQGWERAAFFTEDIISTDQLYEPLIDDISDTIDVVVKERTSQSITNWEPLLNQAEDEDVDITIVNLVLTGSTLARQYAANQPNFDIGGLHVPSFAGDFYDRIGGGIDGLWTINMCGRFNNHNPRMEQMLQRFKDEYGYTAGTSGIAMGYDAVNVYLYAVKQMGTTDSEELIPFLEKMTFENSVQAPKLEFQAPNDPDRSVRTYTHDMVWDSYPEQGWPLYTQWQKVDGQPELVVVGPDTARGEDIQYQRPPWVN